MGGEEPAAGHRFQRAPHRTLLALSFPVLLSLIAEPLTGLADTAFVARLGAAQMAALGVGTMALSSIFWVFNFIGIGVQTEVAGACGAGDSARARQASATAVALAAVAGICLLLVGLPAAGAAATALGAADEVHGGAAAYLRIRLLAAPAVLVMTTAFGVLRGMQDMRTPVWIAAGTNILNVVLDALFIFGAGPVPAFGLPGAAAATAVSHLLGAVAAVAAVGARLGWSIRLVPADATRLLVVGRDMFVRTSLLTLFLLLTTRTATRIGAESGAAHQAVRQVWLLMALVLDAYAATAQSLVGFFLGAGRAAVARQAARVTCLWSLATGIALALLMLLAEAPMAALLVPGPAQPLFFPAWRAAAAFQPLNALAFATDGIHWGSGDFRYLRNVMMVATLLASAALLVLVDEAAPGALTWIWMLTGGWVSVRALLGMLRIWPGIRTAPLAAR